MKLFLSKKLTPPPESSALGGAAYHSAREPKPFSFTWSAALAVAVVSAPVVLALRDYVPWAAVVPVLIAAAALVWKLLPTLGGGASSISAHEPTPEQTMAAVHSFALILPNR